MAITIALMTKEAPPSRTAPQFVVRLPDEEFKDRIAEAAKSNNRSMNAEIVARLQESFAVKTDGDPVAKIERTLHEMQERQQAKDNSLTMIRQLIAQGYLDMAALFPKGSPVLESHQVPLGMARAVTTLGAPGLEEILISLVGGKKGEMLAKGIAGFVRETEIDFSPQARPKPKP